MFLYSLLTHCSHGNKTIILCTHEAEATLQYATKMTVCYSGRNMPTHVCIYTRVLCMFTLHVYPYTYLQDKEKGRGWLWLSFPCFPWLIDMKQGSQAPIIHEVLFKGNQDQLSRPGPLMSGRVVRARAQTQYRCTWTPESRCTLTDPVLPESSPGTS